MSHPPGAGGGATRSSRLGGMGQCFAWRTNRAEVTRVIASEQGKRIRVGIHGRRALPLAHELFEGSPDADGRACLGTLRELA